MKKLVVLLIALFSAAAFAQDLPRIAVYVTGNVGEDEKKALGTRMLATLVNSGRYTGIERSNSFLAEIEKEQAKQRSGAIDDNQISQLGRQFGVKFVCIADITPVLGEFQVSARIVNVETAVVVFIGEAFSPMKTTNDLAVVSDKVIENMFSGKTTTPQKTIIEPIPQPAPKTYTVAAAANPPDGGSVSRSPNYTAYYAGTPVTVTASPNAGYTFAGWSGVTAPVSNSIIFTVENNLTLTANFQRIPQPPQPPPPPAVSETKTETVNTEPEPKPEPTEKIESNYRRLQKRIGVEIGGVILPYAHSYNSNNPGGGDEIETSDYSGFGLGGYLHIDLIYLEMYIDPVVENYKGDIHYDGTDFSYNGAGIAVKCPFVYEFVKVSPLFGLGFIINAGGFGGPFILGGEIDVGITEIAYIRSEYRYYYGDMKATSFKIGGGIDIGLDEGKKAYLRTELLYNYTGDDEIDGNFDKRHSLELRAGIGYKWGGGKKPK